MKKLLYIFLLLLPILSNAQVSLLSGNLQISGFPTALGGDKFLVTGTFNDTKGLFFASDISTGMYMWKGNSYYVVDSIYSVAGGNITFRVTDPNLTGFISGGSAGIMELSANGIPAIPSTGDSNASFMTPADYSALMSYIASMIGAGGASAITIAKTSHGYSQGQPIYWDGDSWEIPTNDTLIAVFVVIDSTTANTFTAAASGTFDTDIADGFYYQNDGAYSTTKDTIETPLFVVADGKMTVNPILGYDLLATEDLPQVYNINTLADTSTISSPNENSIALIGASPYDSIAVYGDSWNLVIGGGGIASTITIAQSGHSFDLDASPWNNYGFIPVYTDTAGIVSLAQADSVTTTATGFIVGISGDNLTIQSGDGYVLKPVSSTLQIGQFYWLSSTQAGYITATEPDTSQIVCFVEDEYIRLIDQRVVDNTVETQIDTVYEAAVMDTLDLAANKIFRLDLTDRTTNTFQLKNSTNGQTYVLQFNYNLDTIVLPDNFYTSDSLYENSIDDILVAHQTINFYATDTAYYTISCTPPCVPAADRTYDLILSFAEGLGMTLPADSIQEDQRALVATLKAEGIWDDLDAFFVVSDQERFSRVNWKKLVAADTAIIAGTMTFTANDGWQGNGTNGSFQTNYVPSTEAVNYSASNASAFIYIVTANTQTGEINDFGSTSLTAFSTNLSGTNYWLRINQSGDNNFSRSGGPATGFFHLDISGGTRAFYVNGSPVTISGSSGSTTPTIPNAQYTVGSYGAQYGNTKFSAWGAGGTLGSKAATLNTAITTYLNTL